MKKYLAILLGMIAVFGFAGSAFAIHLDIPSDDSTPAVASGNTSITLSGELRARYDFRHVGFVNDSADKAFFDERVRLGFEAKLSPNTKGFIQLESNSGDTNNGAPDSYPWGTLATNNQPSTRTLSYGFPNSVQAGNYMPNGLSILNAWIQHSGTGLLGVNSGFKIGHQPIILPNGLFLDHSYYGDDGIVLFVNPIKELEIDAIYLKLRQQFAGTTNSLNNADSTNGYALAVNYKPSKVTSVSFDATYLDVQNANDLLTAGTATNLNMGTIVGSAFTATGSPWPDVHLWNFGLHGNTEISGIRLMADGELQTGTIDLKNIAANNIKLRGYAAKAGIGYTLQPVKLTLEAAYGSGQSSKDADNNKIAEFITFQGPTPHFSYVYDYRTVNAAGAQFGGLQNTMYLKLDMNADVTKDLNVDVAVMELQAAHAIKNVYQGNVFNGTGFGPVDSTGTQTVAFSATALKNMMSRHIGEEVDGTITYQLDKGLKLYTEGGYLWAGDFWKALNNTVSTRSQQNAYTVREGVQLNF